jgi:hypothetical protein
MLKRPLHFSLLNRFSNFTPLSNTANRRIANKAAGNMADYDPAEPSDLVNTSKDLDVEGRGRNGRQGGKGKGKGPGGRGGGGGGGGGRGGGEMNREVAVSKALSKLLRHAAEDAGLTLDGEGFARLDQVVRLPTFVLLPLLRE